jgi:hypothetical protein
MALIYIKVLSRNSSGVNYENHVDPKKKILQPRFKPHSSKLRAIFHAFLAVQLRSRFLRNIVSLSWMFLSDVFI